MFEEILPKAALDKILSLKPLNTFYLAGGTGLALQLGHRISEDFNIFSDQSFNTDAIVATIKLFFERQIRIFEIELGM